MKNIFQSSDLNDVVNGMFAYMKMQIENPALANSRFRFDEVLFILNPPMTKGGWMPHPPKGFFSFQFLSEMGKTF